MLKNNISVAGVCAVALSAFLLTGCSGDQDSAADKAIVAEMEEENKAQQVFYSLPSPFELASLLKNSGATFNKDILNAPENLTKYTSSSSKAINLGVYGADLSYASIFGQTQASMSYLNCVRTLTDELGISSAFDKNAMDRLERNKSNDDSLQQIVAEAYLIANSYLKDNERSNMATFILAGGLIEGLYIASSLSNEGNTNEDLTTMIADQKFALENLVAMLESYEGDDASVLLADFKSLMEVYNKIDQNAAASIQVTTDTASNTTVIGGEDELAITPEQLKAINEKVIAIRTKLIN